MKKAILATKVGMTQIFAEDGAITVQAHRIAELAMQVLFMKHLWKEILQIGRASCRERV